MQAIKDYKVTKFIPFNPVDKKTSATVTFPSGETVITCKGAPQVQCRLVRIDMSCCTTACKQVASVHALNHASRHLSSPIGCSFCLGVLSMLVLLLRLRLGSLTLVHCRQRCCGQDCPCEGAFQPISAYCASVNGSTHHSSFLKLRQAYSRTC